MNQMDKLNIKQFSIGSMGEVFLLLENGMIYEGEIEHIGVGQKKINITQKVEIDLLEINKQ